MVRVRVVGMRVVGMRVWVVGMRIWMGNFVFLSPGLAVLLWTVTALVLPCRENGGRCGEGGPVSIVLTWWRSESGRW